MKYSIAKDPLFPHFQEKVIITKGAQLYCRLFGQGDPILIIHGAPMLSQDYLLPYMADLSENHFLIFYDQRGCGKSVGELTEEFINMPTFVKDIDAIRTALNIDNLTVLGHSWGGFLAMKYAIEYPGSLNKLILLDTLPPSDQELNQFNEEKTRRRAHIGALHKIEATESYKFGKPQTTEKRLKMHFQTYLYNPHHINKLHFALTQEAFLSGSKVLDLLNNNFFLKPYNLYNDLSKIKAPTLILHGDTDPIFFTVAEHIHHMIPHSKLVKIEHCGHFPHVEQPKSMFTAIESFLK